MGIKNKFYNILCFLQESVFVEKVDTLTKFRFSKADNSLI